MRTFNKHLGQSKEVQGQGWSSFMGRIQGSELQDAKCHEAIGLACRTLLTFLPLLNSIITLLHTVFAGPVQDRKKTTTGPDWPPVATRPKVWLHGIKKTKIQLCFISKNWKTIGKPVATGLFCGPTPPPIWDCIPSHLWIFPHFSRFHLDFSYWYTFYPLENEYWLQKWYISMSTWLFHVTQELIGSYVDVWQLVYRCGPVRS